MAVLSEPPCERVHTPAVAETAVLAAAFERPSLPQDAACDLWNADLHIT